MPVSSRYGRISVVEGIWSAYDRLQRSRGLLSRPRHREHALVRVCVVEAAGGVRVVRDSRPAGHRVRRLAAHNPLLVKPLKHRCLVPTAAYPQGGRQSLTREVRC